MRKRCLYEFTLKALHQYYRDMYNKLLPVQGYEELNVPAITEIDNYQDYLVNNRIQLPKHAL